MTTIERKLSNALTVEELIDELQQYPKDARVVFACDYGDHSHTTQALPIETVDENTTEETIIESGYSSSGLAIRNAEECDAYADDAEATEGETFIILR
jgi:hypothetical protein